MRSVDLVRMAALVAATPGAIVAQSVTADVVHQSYSMQSAEAVRLESLASTALVFGASTHLIAGTSLSIGGAWAHAVMTVPGGASAAVQGPTDLDVTIRTEVKALAISLTALLPTGRVVQSTEEAALVGLLGADLLPITVPQWGTGGAVAADFGLEGSYSSHRLGVSAGYVLPGASEPLGSELSYRPGHQIRVRGFLDSAIGDASVLTIVLAAQHFDSDRYDSTNLFTPGLRLHGGLSFAHAFGARESLRGYAYVSHLEAGSAAWPFLPPPQLGSLLPGASPQPGRSLARVGGEMHAQRGDLAFVPHVELRLLRREDGLGQGWMSSVGAKLQYRWLGDRFGQRLLVEPAAAFRPGRLTAAAGATSVVRGWEARLTFRWEGSE